MTEPSTETPNPPAPDAAALQADFENALEAARAEVRQAVTSEYGDRLAQAELRAHAAAAGVELPALQYLNVGAFVTDGTVNSDAISQFVSSLPQPATKPAFAQNLGLGRQGGSPVPQRTTADISRMTHAQVNAAFHAGQFAALQRGET
ncbi:hypothetical protein ABT354_11270 [Streptomyces sp. NPDC000594]|uniref:hypothetical protein n=1 Tax=Streptomyces sp. NPDC000594 TaxID=3154261 RepID=UPI003317728B